jgi:hypothetical protein
MRICNYALRGMRSSTCFDDDHKRFLSVPGEEPALINCAIATGAGDQLTWMGKHCTHLNRQCRNHECSAQPAGIRVSQNLPDRFVAYLRPWREKWRFVSFR